MNVTPLVKVKLSRPWGPYPEGAEVEVDAVKAGTLDELGYLLTHEESPRSKRKK